MKASLILAAMVAAPLAAQGAVILTNNTPYVQTFDGFAGTSATVPANFVTAGTSTFMGILTSGSSTYNGSNGWYALNDNGSTADRAFGSRAPAGSTYTLTAQFTNNSGYAFTGLTITYKTEQYTGSDPNAPGTITLTGSTNGTTFNTTNLTGNTSTSLQTGSMDTVFADPLIQNRSATYTGTILNGQSVWLRFTWVPAGGGSRAIWGVDDFSVAAIPEPAALTLVGLLIPMALRRRRSA